MALFVIEDELHDERHGVFFSLDDALSELRRRASIPWDQEPNQAPCQSWRTCRRVYEIVEFDETQTPWKEMQRTSVVEISAAGVRWSKGFEPSSA